MADLIPSIVTRRLTLRNITEEDGPSIVAWRSDPAVYRYFLDPRPIDLAGHLAWFRFSYLKNEDRCDWMAWTRDGLPAGVFGIRRENPASTEAEISYILAPSLRGQGFASEAIQALLTYLSLCWGCQTAAAEIHRDNAASIAFARRQNMEPASARDGFVTYRKAIGQPSPVYIRADGNQRIGAGHLMRCLSIADRLRDLGRPPVFLTGDTAASGLIQEHGFFALSMDTPYDQMEQELPVLEKVLRNGRPQVFLADSYFVTKAYLQAVHALVPTVYMDDLDQAVYPVDGLINYNIYGGLLDYSDYEKTGARLLLGPAYAPLRAEFSDIRPRVFSGIRRVLVTSGGTDPMDFIGRFLAEILGKEAFRDLEYYCVLGRFNQNADRLRDQFRNEPGIHLLQNVTNMSDYMKKCDLAISAGGSTLYELCACGTPTIQYTLADNQLGAARAFSEQGLIPWAGDIRTDMEESFRVIEREMERLSAPGEWEARTAALQRVVDGRGAGRIARALLEIGGQKG